MDDPFSTYKEKLEKELRDIETDLTSVGRKNPDDPTDWEATVPATDPDTLADAEERADTINTIEDNIAIEAEMEKHLRDVRAALLRIDEGTYGTCSVCGNPIEEARLLANPSAVTCIKDRNAA